MLWLALLACDPVVPQTISGRLRVGPYLGSGPVQGGTITIFDGGGDLFDQGIVAEDGSFSVTGPEGRPLVASIEGDGLVESVFAGVLGVGPFEVNEGELFGWSDEMMSELRTTFGRCGEDAGAVVTGEMQLFGAETSTGDPLTVITGTAVLVAADGTVVPACYLDDNGAFDPDATVTGATGRFAFFGVSPGDYRLDYGYVFGEVEVPAQLFLTVREDAIVPLYPAWIDVPL